MNGEGRGREDRKTVKRKKIDSKQETEKIEDTRERVEETKEERK